MPMPVGAAPSRHAASTPIKTREEVLEAVKSGAFPLKDNERDSLRNRSTPLCGSPLRSLYTLLILPLALTRIVLFIVVFTSTGCTAALAACLPARSCGRRCLLAIAMRGIRAGLFCLGYHYIKQTGKPSKDAKIVCANHVSFVETFYLTSLLTPCGMAEIETVLTQRLFLNVSELQLRVDGVNAMPRRLDAVDVAVREPTRLVSERRQFRDAVVRRRPRSPWSPKSCGRSNSFWWTSRPQNQGRTLGKK